MATKKTILRRALMSGLITILLLLLTSASSFAQEQPFIQSFKELNLIKIAISAQNANWTAGETSVSQLPPEFRERLLGLRETKFYGDKKILSMLKQLLDKNLQRLIPDFRSHLRWCLYPAIWHLDGVAKTTDNIKPEIQTPINNLLLIGDCVKAPGIGMNCAINSARICQELITSTNV